MKLLSINVALPKTVAHGGVKVETGIFKRPVSGPVKVQRLNIEGDRQADLSVHGGVNKAVYAYSWKNVEYWKKFLGRDDLGPGSFGENLTINGLLDNEMSIGDELQIGTGKFQVTQPRFPCFKLGIAMGHPEFVRTFDGSGRNGFYLSVLQEGTIAAGDKITRIASTNPAAITVAEFVGLYHFQRAEGQKFSSSELRRLVSLDALPDSIRVWLKKERK